MADTELLELSIDELLLDLENPRLGTLSAQSEALEALVRMNARHFRNLMESIKDHGLDPGDSLYVIKADNGEDYVVVEGNRRLSALMALSNPSLLEATNLGATEKKNLTAMAKGFKKSAVEPLRCTLFSERSVANEWIYRRHTGQADGEGRIDWGPLEKQRFSGDRTVLDIIDFMARNGGYEAEEWTAVYQALRSNATTLSRFLESKAGREFFGLSNRTTGNKTTPVYSVPDDFVIRGLKQVFRDVQDGMVDSRTHNKAGEIEGYFRSMRDRLGSPDKTGDKGKKFSDVNVPGNEATNQIALAKSVADKAQAVIAGKATRARPPRVTLAPKLHQFKQPETTKGQALVREAGRLNADEFPLGCAYLLRAFLEHTIDVYMTAAKLPRWKPDKNGANQELNLQGRYDSVVEHLGKAGTVKAQDLRGLSSALTHKTDPVSIQSLNDYHHNTYRLPVGETLRAAWDSAVPLFSAVYGGA